MPGASRRDERAGETDELPLADPVVEGVLAAVDGPALVCDANGRVRAWNDAFSVRTRAGTTVADAPIERLLEWEDEDPLGGTRTGEEATAVARLVADGRRYGVTVRGLPDGAGAVVTFADTLPSEWPVYEAALDASPDTIYVFDTDYRIRAVSERFERSTRVPTAEVTGEPLDCLAEYGIVTPETVERGRDALADVFAGRREEVSVALEPAVDTGTVVECKFAPVEHDGAVVGAVAVVRDVTDRERAAEAHRRNQERLRTVLESLPVGMVVVDGDGRIDHVQGFDLAAVPCERSDLIGAPVEAFADSDSGIVDGCRRALEGEAGSTTVTVGDRTYEAVFEPVTDDGTVTGTICVAVDVTDREERERELGATNERLAVALSNTDAGVYEWNADEDRVEWHGTAVGLFDLDPDRQYSLAAVVDEHVNEADRDRVRAAVADAAANGHELAVEFRLDRAGDERWAIAEGEVHAGDDGSTRIVGTVRDVSERKRRERALAERERRLRAVIESSADPIAMQDTEGCYRVVNEAFVEVTDCPRASLQDATPEDVFDVETAQRVERHRRDVLETEAARVVEERIQVGDGPERVVQLTVAPHYDPDGAVRGTVTIARDITTLERQREELETLTAIQELVQESVRGATTADTREAIKRTVCDRLAESSFYEAAWIGSMTASTRELTPDYAAGDATEYLDDVSITVDTGERGQGPGGSAYRSGEVQVVDDVRTDPDFEPWREAALDRGFESVAVVPLTYGSTTHGVLALYTDRPDPFSDREIEGFETLGAAVGFALSAAQHRRLLEADRLLELEYVVESDTPFVNASAEHDCRFVVSDAVHARDGKVLNYLTVDGADPAVGEAIASDHDGLVSIRRLESGDEEGPHFEVKWRESVFQYLAEAGARGVRGVIEDGVGRLYVEAPSDVDVRRVTDAVRHRFDEVSLAAKRERERSDSPWWHAHGDIGTTLTDRQRGVLQTAYYSGYYEWPREADAETLADSLDIATSTFLQHLRKGHRRILETTFDS